MSSTGAYLRQGDNYLDHIKRFRGDSRVKAIVASAKHNADTVDILRQAIACLMEQEQEQRNASHCHQLAAAIDHIAEALTIITGRRPCRTSMIVESQQPNEESAKSMKGGQLIQDGEVLYRCLNADCPQVHRLEIERYPAGEPLITETTIPARILLRPTQLETVFAVMWWVDALQKRSRLCRPTLILPAVPGSRQDRLNTKGDQLFTLASVAKEINARDFNEVIVLDPHSDVTAALIDHCRVISAADVFRTVQSHWDGVVAPDGGAVKRAAAVADLLRVPLYHGWKRREVATGKLSGFGVEPIPALDGSNSAWRRRNLLVVDDICDGGRTFLGVAAALKAHGSPLVSLYVTHGYFTAGTIHLTDEFDQVLTTDSVLGPRAHVKEVGVCLSLLTGDVL